ncbi:hypothetical protein ANN_25295 [Periplaneta americana]|uniref:Endonuclease-reverse transcriptase n=1 Tax=Periplaneta americana TaxID=6978 RepID=A0ABQ8S0Z7_PERAM|nr:hypothetical protein ANN_25295 [Periplaneta americana]
MIMSRDGNIVRNGNIKIGDLSFEEVEKFKYLGATVTNINDTREEIKRRINMGNACYYSVEKLLSSSLLSKNLKVRIYKTVILPVLLYGCETWTLTLREEHRLRVFENKVLRKIFGAKRDEVTGEWRKLHNTELHALYSSPDIIRNLKSRRLRWAGHVARMGESRNAYRVLVGRPEGKRPLGRPRRRWEDNIKMDLREVGYDDRDWLNLAQDRDRWRAYVRAAMNLRKNPVTTWDRTPDLPFRSQLLYQLSYPAALLLVCIYINIILREEYRLRVFENKVLRKIFGAKRDEVKGEWRKLHNAELHALYSSPDIIRNIKSRRLRWAGHVARIGESRNAYSLLVGRPEGKRPLGRPRRRWEDNIKMDLREVGYDDRYWINLAQDRDQWRAYVRAAMNLRVPEKPFDMFPNLRNPEHANVRLKNVGRQVYLCVKKDGKGNSVLGTKTIDQTIDPDVDFSLYYYTSAEAGETKMVLPVHQTTFICLSMTADKKLEKSYLNMGKSERNAELHALYTSRDIISNIKSRRLRWARHVARMGESRNAYRVLVGRPEGKRPLGRPRRRWEDNIKMDLREVGYDGRDWINLAQDRDQWRAYVRAAMNLRVR